MTKDEWAKILFGENERISELMKQADAKISEAISDVQEDVDEETRLMVVHALISYFDFYLSDVLEKHLKVSPELLEMTKKWSRTAAEIDIAHVLDNADQEIDELDLDPDDRITMKGGDA